MEREIEGRRQHFQTVCQNGEKLKSEALHASKAIGLRIITLQERWKKLNELCGNRRQRLEEGVQLQQASEFSILELLMYKLMFLSYVYVHMNKDLSLRIRCTCVHMVQSLLHVYDKKPRGKTFTVHY